ncbi:hypothetical protein M0804_010902 [Polistes exclamans]|nr:hypothetical protein M0804_010902 [Polistes exclamans]
MNFINRQKQMLDESARTFEYSMRIASGHSRALLRRSLSSHDKGGVDSSPLALSFKETTPNHLYLQTQQHFLDDGSNFELIQMIR